MTPNQLLQSVKTILVIDWPSKDVPESLTRAGFRVFVHEGPGPEDYSTYELNDGHIAIRHTGHPPERADLVYSYRPLSELAETVAAARAVHAHTIWTQSGASAAGIDDPKGCWLSEEDRRSARRQVQAAGLNHVTEPYVADVARAILAKD